MEAREIVGSTTDPAFSVDPRGRINAWNEAAERLFGRTAAEVRGRSCWQVLRSRDIFGNDYCEPTCRLRAMASQNRAIHPCDLVIDDATGVAVRLHVSALRAPVDGTADWSLVHLISTVSPETDPPGLPAKQPNKAISRLTSREAEVLALLAEGHGTRRVAEELGVSGTTVRNHVQRILGKLRVHSRLEAVALARRLGLVP